MKTVRILAALFALLACASIYAFEARLTLSNDVATWNETVQANVEGIGCVSSISQLPIKEVSPGVWNLDVVTVFCGIPGPTVPFSKTITLGPLYPGTYHVRLVTLAAPVTELAVVSEITLKVYEEATADIVFPAVATDAAPARIVFRVPVTVFCGSFDPPTIKDNTISQTFSDVCPILPPEGQVVRAEEQLVGPLAAGEYDVRFFIHAANGQQQLFHRKLTVYDADRCVPSDTTLCLGGNRFRAEVAWQDFRSQSGKGHAVPLPDRDDSGLFWFFGADNVELTLKVLNGCGVNNRQWVFVSSGTTVPFVVTVTDTETGAVKTYTNLSGQAQALIADTEAFSCK